MRPARVAFAQVNAANSVVNQGERASHSRRLLSVEPDGATI